MKHPLPGGATRSLKACFVRDHKPSSRRCPRTNRGGRVAIEEMVGTVCFRPILLTALAAADVILTDPIFQRLTVRLMAGGIVCMHLAPLTVPLPLLHGLQPQAGPKHQPGASAAGGEFDQGQLCQLIISLSKFHFWVNLGPMIGGKFRTLGFTS